MNAFQFVRTQKNQYDQNTIPVPGIGEWSQKEYIDKIDSYWADQYEEDDAYDDVIGAYPFENIHKAPTLLEARATDFDKKHIENEPKNGSRRAKISAMIVTKAIQNHMEDINFGKFLNDLSYTRAKYGGVHVSKQGEEIVVDSWQQLITDQADIMSAPYIKRMYMSPSEILKMQGAWKNTKEALKAAEQFRNQEIEDNSSDEAESTGSLIPVYIVEGDMKVSTLYEAQADRDYQVYEEQEDDNYTYVYARIILCGAEWVNKKTKAENGIVFYAEEEKIPLRKYLARNPMTGRGLGESVPESLFEPQKWWNFYVTEEVRMTSIAGKKLYVTDDPDILDNIFDEGVDHGHVLRVSQGKTLTELNQIPTGTPMYQNRRQEMFQNIQRITSSYSAAMGEEAKSGTPFRAQYLQNIEAHSQFEQYREEIGFFIKEIIEDWVLPDALAKASDEVFSVFNPQELQLIDEVIVESNITDALIKATMEGEVIPPEVVEDMRLSMQGQLRREGSKRTIKGIKQFIKEAGDKVRIHTTDEARNKAVLFESYANLLNLLEPTDPRFAALIDKVMQAVGITKEELELYTDQSVQAQRGQVNSQQLQQENQPRAQAVLSQ